jgi:hypothetical protein
MSEASAVVEQAREDIRTGSITAGVAHWPDGCPAPGAAL